MVQEEPMDLNELSRIPQEQRNTSWEDQFLASLALGQVAPLSPDPFIGPDGWPYFGVSTEASKNQEPTQKILCWLSSRGIGLVVNPQKSVPDFVLNYGMIWFFCHTGRFIQRVNFQNSNSHQEKVEYSPSTLAHAGTPTEEYLPTSVRQVLKSFFMDQAVFNPRMILLSQDRKHYDLAISAESLGSPDESEWADLVEALSWFLPLHYSVVIIREKGLVPFVPII